MKGKDFERLGGKDIKGHFIKGKHKTFPVLDKSVKIHVFIKRFTRRNMFDIANETGVTTINANNSIAQEKVVPLKTYSEY